MLNHGAMRTIDGFSHNLPEVTAKVAKRSTNFLQNIPKSSKITQRMQAEARQKRIQDYLNKVEFASLEELAGAVEASVSTVRRDVASMAASGNLRRTHGGARLFNPHSEEFTFTARDTHQLTEKEIIGRACAELTLPRNQTVIIDAGDHHLSCRKISRTKKPTSHHEFPPHRQSLLRPTIASS